MENNSYNSLSEQLIQSGILQGETKIPEHNFFETPKEFEPKEQNAKKPKPDKRINEYDMELIKNSSSKDDIKNTINFKTAISMKLLKRLFNRKQNDSAGFEKLFSRFFPELYRAKLVKDSINKLLELNIDTKTLLNKTIPYGESDERYDDLIKFLNCANELQIKLKGKF